MSKQIRVRFAPSPTGGLHLGGVRTVLYNYLYAKQHKGQFIVRIEDTDQSRFVPGAEAYILSCLEWCGLEPDESPIIPGAYGPYRQSERKAIYRSYAEQLIKDGYAYYAFDTPDELDQMRQKHKTDENPSPQYDGRVRVTMKNSLTLPADTVERLLIENVPHVIRIKMPEQETIRFTDLIHDEVSFDSSLTDDKVLLKADGMPTYHLAVVVDDYLMNITHAFRGEEWLSSAPVHFLLWKYLFGLDKMPQWAHLPLILGPSGKLSKRDGAKYGFPVFAMNWTDQQNNILTEGFRERGFLPEAFINMLAMLGWHDGTEQELFSLDDLIEKFSIERVHKSGAKFDFEKAKWFNHEWIKKLPADRLLPDVKQVFESKNIECNDNAYLLLVINMIKDRCTLLPDFFEQGHYFFQPPPKYDTEAVLPKWDQGKINYFNLLADQFSALENFSAATIEQVFKSLATEQQIKVGELQMIFRVMLVGSKIGPAVFQITETIGKAETITRIKQAIGIFIG